jgi:hypothetical protein
VPPVEDRPTPPGKRPQAAKAPAAKGSMRKGTTGKTGTTAAKPKRPRKE